MAEQQPTESPAASTTARVRSNPLFREIHKNTWLKRVPSTDSKRKREKVWVVFCVHDDVEAFLEGYSDNKISVLHKPEWCVSLNDTQHISPTICPSDQQEYEFVITLNTEVIRLAATSWELMSEWVESLRAKLQELKVLSPKENLYSKLPEAKIPLLPTRDPTSPLPPTPRPSTSIAQPRVAVTNNNVTIIQLESPTSGGDGRLATPTASGAYERLFHQRTAVPTLQPAPQPYRTLREQQVIQLQTEIEHPGGVRLQLRRKDCVNSIALVDGFGAVWICGWKQREHPMLYNALHIGDQLLSTEGTPAHNSVEAYKLLRSAQSLYVNIVVRRVPFGRVFVIRRDAEGQPLGIVQEGNTAVISTVIPDGLAARHGLSARAKTCDGLSFTNWVLTEINGRPLNLFCKENQARDRLNSVGRDISILVQPLDLIKQLKKQLKSIRNYKEYIIQ